MERDRARLVTMMTTPRLMLITIIGTLPISASPSSAGEAFLLSSPLRP
jgi:hypothetical protein